LFISSSQFCGSFGLTGTFATIKFIVWLQSA
jgi:hypothetical protein